MGKVSKLHLPSLPGEKERILEYMEARKVRHRAKRPLRHAVQKARVSATLI